MFEPSKEYTAAELFNLVELNPVQGLPAFANLKADWNTEKAKPREELKGPGVYALFCKGRLYYIGIYTGVASETFAGSVLERWAMHLTYHSLRSPKICFSRRSLARIAKHLHGEPVEAILERVGGRTANFQSLSHLDSPLVEKNGASCTFNKVNFASLNWDIFQPGDLKSILQNVTFGYAKIDDSAKTRLGESKGTRAGYLWVKRKWLEKLEGKLVSQLSPICNAKTPFGKHDGNVTYNDFKVAVVKNCAGELPTFR